MVLWAIKRQSQQLQRFDLELDAIFISVFINRATWNLITHAHLCTWYMEEKVLVVISIVITFVNKYILIIINITRIIKNIFNKNERRCRDVKTQKACKQGWEANIGPKIKQTTSI